MQLKHMYILRRHKITIYTTNNKIKNKREHFNFFFFFLNIPSLLHIALIFCYYQLSIDSDQPCKDHQSQFPNIQTAWE